MMKSSQCDEDERMGRRFAPATARERIKDAEGVLYSSSKSENTASEGMRCPASDRAGYFILSRIRRRSGFTTLGLLVSGVQFLGAAMYLAAASEALDTPF